MRRRAAGRGRAQGPGPGDVAAVIAVLLAGLWLVGPPTGWLRDGVIYVSPDGADWRLGGSPESAVRTIQRAADLVTPGEEVVILPGTYREWLRIRRGGEPGRPVVFRAAEPGTVTITGDAEPSVVEALEWRDEGGGVFSAEVPWAVHRVRVEGRDVYPVLGGVARLESLAARETAWDAFLHRWEDGRVHLHVRGGRDPASVRVTFHRPIPIPNAWGHVRSANVWVEADHVVLEGLRLQGGVDAAVLLWDGDAVVVRDCLLEGAVFGVQTRPTVDPPNDLVVEHSLYHNYPQHAWRTSGWLSWDEVYWRYPSSTMVAWAADGVRIRSNVILHGGDALRLPGGDRGGGAEVTGNLIHGITDDAFELDGPARNVTLRRNLVYDAHESLGLSPVTHGPVRVEDNLFLHPAAGINGAQLKLLNAWFRSSPELVIRNIEVRRNTFVGNWLAWWNSKMPVEDVAVADNLFAVRYATDPPFPPGVEADGNEIVFLEEGDPDPGHNPVWWDRREGSPTPPEWTEVGAVEPGDVWSIPRPGPRWLDFRDHPASAEIPLRLDPRLFRR